MTGAWHAGGGLAPARLVVRGGRPLRGVLRVPGDKSISHRALLLAALADGTSELRGLSDGDDVARTRAAIEALGAVVAPAAGGDGVAVTGGRERLHEPADVVDVGNSGTTMRLLAGVAAGFDWLTVVTGDASLRRRPMARVAEPLRRMGAAVDGPQHGSRAPLAIRGGDLKGIDYELPVASAQLKGTVLLAGLAAEGETVVREQVPTRTHSEELLAAAGADVSVDARGLTVRVRASVLRPLDLDVPGDPSQAAFWLTGACLVAGSDVTVEDVYLGPARHGFLAVLARMGASIERVGEGAVRVRAAGPLHATEIGGPEIPGLIDELPILCVAAACAEGTTTIRDAGELRVKESDRVATIAAQLAAFGVDVEVHADGLSIRGRPSGLAAPASPVATSGDHRVAMAAAIAALTVEEGETGIEGWESVATSYPGFEADLVRLCRS